MKIRNGEIYELMGRNYCVYEHVNKINGKKYIGMTVNPKHRWRNNGYHYRQCPHFWAAIQKYGWDNFEHTILRKELTHMEACELEIKLIAEQETIEKGYNLATGGSTAVTTTPEQRKAHSLYMSRKNRNPDTNPLTNGKVVWGKTHPYPTSLKVKVTEIDGTELIFESKKECAQYYGISQTTMGRILAREQPYKPFTISASRPEHQRITGYKFEAVAFMIGGKEYDYEIPYSSTAEYASEIGKKYREGKEGERNVIRN